MKLIKNNYISHNYNLKHIAFIVLLLVFFSRGWNYVAWDFIFPRRYYTIVGLIFFLMILFIKNKNANRYSNYIKYWIFAPLLTICLTPLFGGDFFNEIGATYSWTVLASLYFLFHKIKISEQNLIYAFLIFALFSFLIQIFQQFFPEKAVFGILKYDDLYGRVAEIRNGLYRFRLGVHLVVLFCLFYALTLVKKRINIYSTLLLSIFMVSIYLDLTRQVLIAVALTIVFFLAKEKQYKIIFTLVPIICLALYLYWNELFGSLISDYKDNTYTTDIRSECMEFMLNKIVSNPLAFFFGYGHIPEETVWMKKGYYLSDIGFIGQAVYYGIIWIVIYFSVSWKLFVSKCPLYVKYFVLCTGLDSIMIFPYYDQLSMFVWISIIYLASINLNSKKI